eukprot:763724-Hanusia_phi.AAC.7
MGNEQSMVPGIDMCCAKRSSAKPSDRREQVEEGDLLVRSKSDKRIISSWESGNINGEGKNVASGDIVLTTQMFGFLSDLLRLSRSLRKWESEHTFKSLRMNLDAWP